ncbi:serine/threonine-protein kinase [Burkholderia dolosa]|uniref:Serine/threonine protein kinase n=1 Tax=Burkholderia dolosa TaxID=152500 RepID=A0A892IED4_9BURK|nr:MULTISPECIES: serine/threonine-protein kinase [Burkholderia]AJY11642.1 kinase domain protein [Burkholderia dolosa AU0158]AYZ95731.1 hypothetical protein EGY28_11135 [Burkholderia dolosa]MBR8420508.1 serine/threonine protein kinase [Burkholderia dolosa]MBY4658672.1 serine/threonine-protein kinase [Burkholderia dolosa]MBY4688848.1 serine/threonine-protein kinase [Burkholderia dolosa]
MFAIFPVARIAAPNEPELGKGRDNSSAGKATSSIWPAENESTRFEYEKVALLGEGGQKRCWRIASSDVEGDAVLLEYRYPSSLHDGMFGDYDDGEKEQACREAHEASQIHSEKEVAILQRLKGCDGVLQLRRVIRQEGKGLPAQIHAVVDFHNRGNLKALSMANVRLTEREKLDLSLDLLKGLRSTVANNIYLTDIKAENILLDDSSGRLTATMCDFSDAEISSNLTVEDEKHNLECLLDIIRLDIYGSLENSDIDKLIGHDRAERDVCVQAVLHRLARASKDPALSPVTDGSPRAGARRPAPTPAPRDCSTHRAHS